MLATYPTQKPQTQKGCRIPKWLNVAQDDIQPDYLGEFKSFTESHVHPYPTRKKTTLGPPPSQFCGNARCKHSSGQRPCSFGTALQRMDQSQKNPRPLERSVPTARKWKGVGSKCCHIFASFPNQWSLHASVLEHALAIHQRHHQHWFYPSLGGGCLQDLTLKAFWPSQAEKGDHTHSKLGPRKLLEKRTKQTETRPDFAAHETQTENTACSCIESHTENVWF